MQDSHSQKRGIHNQTFKQDVTQIEHCRCLFFPQEGSRVVVVTTLLSNVAPSQTAFIYFIGPFGNSLPPIIKPNNSIFCLRCVSFTILPQQLHHKSIQITCMHISVRSQNTCLSLAHTCVKDDKFVFLLYISSLIHENGGKLRYLCRRERKKKSLDKFR